MSGRPDFVSTRSGEGSSVLSTWDVEGVSRDWAAESCNALESSTCLCCDSQPWTGALSPEGIPSVPVESRNGGQFDRVGRTAIVSCRRHIPVISDG